MEMSVEQWIAFAKGDVPGHAFHGNQYETSEGGGSSWPTQMPSRDDLGDGARSPSEELRLRQIESHLGIDRPTAIAVRNHIEDYYEPDYSQMTEKEWKQTIDLAAKDGIPKIANADLEETEVAPAPRIQSNRFSVIGNVSDHANQRADHLASQIAGTVNPTTNARMAFARRHEQLVGIHRAIAMQLTEAAKTGATKKTRSALRQAAYLHNQAANAHVEAASAHANIVSPIRGQQATEPELATALSRQAAQMSDDADKHTDDAVSRAHTAEMPATPREHKPKEQQLEFRYDKPVSVR
jgi:hypothetical protein